MAGIVDIAGVALLSSVRLYTLAEYLRLTPSGRVHVSLADWVCIVLMLSGIIVFLYGANFYISTVGWAGLYVLILGAVTLLALYIYGELTKKSAQNP